MRIRKIPFLSFLRKKTAYFVAILVFKMGGLVDFQELRFRAGFNSRRGVSDYLKVNITTVNRWENFEVSPPFAVQELMRLLAGELPCSGVGRRDQWQGWRFKDEYIYTPEGERFTAGDIRSIRLLYAQISALKSNIRDLEVKINTLDVKSPALPGNVVAVDFGNKRGVLGKG